VLLFEVEAAMEVEKVCLGVPCWSKVKDPSFTGSGSEGDVSPHACNKEKDELNKSDQCFQSQLRANVFVMKKHSRAVSRVGTKSE